MSVSIAAPICVELLLVASGRAYHPNASWRRVKLPFKAGWRGKGVALSGLIYELQSDALSKDVRVSDLLRKALVVSKKLGIGEIERWINNELGGYDGSEEIPSYREINGEVKVWNPYHGWQPLRFENAEMGEIVSRTHIGQAVSELDSLIEASGSGHLQVPFSQKQINTLMKLMEVPMQPALHVSRTEVIGILDAVRNAVLRWALELEQKGVIGDGMSFSREEKSAAHQVTYNITNIGSMTNSLLQQHSAGSAQVVANAFDEKVLRTFLDALGSKLAQLPIGGEGRSELSSEMQTIESQMKSPRPKVAILRESLKSIRTILEGAAGSVLASDLVAQIGVLLQRVMS